MGGAGALGGGGGSGGIVNLIRSDRSGVTASVNGGKTQLLDSCQTGAAGFLLEQDKIALALSCVGLHTSTSAFATTPLPLEFEPVAVSTLVVSNCHLSTGAMVLANRSIDLSSGSLMLKPEYAALRLHVATPSLSLSTGSTLAADQLAVTTDTLSVDSSSQIAFHLEAEVRVCKERGVGCVCAKRGALGACVQREGRWVRVCKERGIGRVCAKRGACVQREGRWARVETEANSARGGEELYRAQHSTQHVSSTHVTRMSLIIR